MKSVKKRRKFLTFAAATTASMGLIGKSFGASPSYDSQDSVEKDGNVRLFGTKGDGKTDDTKAIQSVLDAGIGCVYFPKGVYRISKSLEMDLQRQGYTKANNNHVVNNCKDCTISALHITKT